MNSNSERIYYLDILRILATFAVMTIHICAQNWNSVDVSSAEWGVFNCLDSISRWAVPVFVMISGVLFLGLERSIHTILSKNVLRVAAAFVFWSALYAGIGYLDDHSVKHFILHFIHGHYHMWFLFLIGGLYLVVPLLRRIVRDEAGMNYFLILGILFTFVIPTAISLISLHSPGYADHLNGILGNVSMTLVVGYSVYYVMGYRLSTIKVSPRLLCLAVAGGLIGFISTILLTRWISLSSGSANQMFYGYLGLNVMLESVCVFVLCRCIAEKHKINRSASTLLSRLSGYSFGAFLVHPLMINILRDYLHLNTLTFNPIVSIPLILILVAAASFLISAAIHKVPVLNRYIV